MMIDERDVNRGRPRIKWRLRPRTKKAERATAVVTERPRQARRRLAARGRPGSLSVGPGMTTTAGFYKNNALLPLLRFSRNNAQQRCRNNGVPELRTSRHPARRIFVRSLLGCHLNGI